MVTVRRWYVYPVCAVSLNTAAWAAIALLRNLLTPGREAPLASTAFQIAVVVVGLPVFLVHWSWAQRLARREADERQSVLRRLYLYGTMAGFLGPFLANAFELIVALLRPIAGRGSALLLRPLVPPLVALGVLGLLWFYHRQVRREDGQITPESGTLATLRRLYLLGFSAVGLTLTGLGAIHLLRWLLFQLGGGAEVIRAGGASLAAEVARMAVGLPVWLFFWGRAQRLFAGADEEERESALRKFYLYGAVLAGVLTTVTHVTVILAGGLRRALDLPAMGDIRLPLPIVVWMAVVWAYHARVLRLDADRAAEAPRQAGIRRLYLYLVAGVGLAALLVGLSGTVSVLIRALAASHLGPALKEQVAWYSAALVAGLPVWLLPWRRAQLGAVEGGGAGAGERGSVVRKIYLYFYLFVATMTVLASAVYIVSQLVSLALGARQPANLLADLGQAIAFALIAAGVWLYHGSALRVDSRMSRGERAGRLSALRVAVVDGGDGAFGRALLEALRAELPDLQPLPIGLTPAATAAMGAPSEARPPGSVAGQLAAAGLIVGPWDILAASNAASTELAAAVGRIDNPPSVLLVPLRGGGVEWAGVDRWSEAALVQQAVRGVRQALEGAPVRAVRPLGAGAIISILVGVVLAAMVLGSIGSYLFGY